MRVENLSGFHVLIEQTYSRTVVVVIISMDERKWVLMRRVEGVLGNERLGFEEIFPLSTHISKSKDGFDRKSFENVGD